MRSAERLELTIAEVLLDQIAVAGLGNVYRSEVLFSERIDPFARVGLLNEGAIERLLRTGARMLRANLRGGARVTMPAARCAWPDTSLPSPGSGRLWVYGRAGRPCRRCGTLIRSVSVGQPPRRLYWCPGCQPPGPG